MAAFVFPYKGIGDDLSSTFKTTNKGVTSAPQRKKKPEQEAAEIMAKARNKRADEVKEKLDIKIRDYREGMKTLTVLKRTKQSLLEEYLSLAKEKKGVLVNEYRKVITQLKISELITAVDVDEEKRLIFTTRPIIIKKAKWKHARLAGVYQIRVDLSASGHSGGIAILNITQRQGGHDHPHIIETSPCWGNIGDDIQQDFKDKNIYELIVDLVDYLQSGADNDGYLQYSGDEEELKKEFGADEKDGTENNTHAWEQFLSKAEKMPPGFCFAMYEQQKKEKHSAPIASDADGSLRFTSVLDMQGSTTHTTLSSAYANGTTASAMMWQDMNGQWVASPYSNNRPVSFYQSEIARNLQELGLTEKAAWHFMDYIKPSETLWIDRLELISRGDVFWLMIYAGPPAESFRMRVEAGDPVFPSMPVQAHEIQRIFINTNDIRPDMLIEFNENGVEHGSRSVRVGIQTNERGRQEIRIEQDRAARQQEEIHRLQNQLRDVIVSPIQPLTSDAIRSPAQLLHNDNDLISAGMDTSLFDSVVKRDDSKQSHSLHSPEESIHHYGIVGASSDEKVVKKKTTKFLTVEEVKENLKKLL